MFFVLSAIGRICCLSVLNLPPVAVGAYTVFTLHKESCGSFATHVLRRETLAFTSTFSD